MTRERGGAIDPVRLERTVSIVGRLDVLDDLAASQGLGDGLSAVTGAKPSKGVEKVLIDRASRKAKFDGDL